MFSCERLHLKEQINPPSFPAGGHALVTLLLKASALPIVPFSRLCFMPIFHTQVVYHYASLITQSFIITHLSLRLSLRSLVTQTSVRHLWIVYIYCVI